MATIAHILDFHPLARRGMETFLLRFAGNLKDRNHRSVFIFSGSPSPEFANELVRLDAPWRVGNFQPTPGEAREWGKWLRPFAPSLMLTTFMPKFGRAMRLLKKKSGVKYWIVADQTSGSVNRGGRLKRLFACARGAFASRYIDHLICPSEFIRQRDRKELFLRVPSTVVPNGIDLARYRPCAPVRDMTVAFAGQLIPEKGAATLIHAVKRVKGARLRIAGKGRQEAELRGMAQEDVDFLGQIDWVPEFFSSASAVVVPSVWEEGFGFVAAEAMACGAATIVSDAGALREVVGDCGLVFRRGDVDDLARQVRRVLWDPDERRRLGQAALRRAQSYGVDRMVDGYVDIVLRVMADVITTARPNAARLARANLPAKSKN